VLTKIHADDYKHVDQAPIDSGWIPVYVGKLSDTIDFDEVDSDPSAPNNRKVKVWTGFPFNHGERWSVSQDGTLFWKWRDYRFESSFDHPELVEKYRKYRDTAGRLYITENGHVWVNVPRDGIMQDKELAIKMQSTNGSRLPSPTMIRLHFDSSIVDWSRQVETTIQRQAISPIHLGHLRAFDGGVIPKPVVDDPTYFQAVCEYEQVWE